MPRHKSNDFLSPNFKLPRRGNFLEAIELVLDIHGDEWRFLYVYENLKDREKTAITKVCELLGQHHARAREMARVIEKNRDGRSRSGKAKHAVKAAEKEKLRDFYQQWRARPGAGRKQCEQFLLEARRRYSDVTAKDSTILNWCGQFKAEYIPKIG